jgi:tetratricopeptide (TPR) repeat protein
MRHGQERGMAQGLPARLVGWKAIGAAIGRDARTARRWEQERGLPVHRVAGGGRDVVWADPEALKNWMSGGRGEPAAPLPESPLPEPSQPEPSPDPVAARPKPRLVLAGAAGLLLAVVGFSLWQLAAPAARAPAAPYSDPPSAALYRDAGFAQATRTPTGLALAADHYAALAKRHPREPAALAGLAETWLLMREFGSLDSTLAYARARSAAEAALKLDSDHGPATRALGFTLFWSEAEPTRGLALLARAVELNSGDAQSLHWHGNALAAAGRGQEGLAALEQARRLSPQNRAIVADHAWQRFLAGDRVGAIAQLETLARIDPAFIGSWRYLELARLVTGDDRGFLEAASVHARLKVDAARLELLGRARVALDGGGRPAMMEVLIADAQARHAAGRETALTLARLNAAAGREAEALHWLEEARANREPYLGTLASLPELQNLVNRPEFRAFSGAP